MGKKYLFLLGLIGSVFCFSNIAMAAFTPKQQNWRWYQNDAAEPTISLAVENGTATLQNNTNIVRLRVTVNNTGASAGNNKAITLQYSLDNSSSWTAVGTTTHMAYADGAATVGNTIVGTLTTDATSKDTYHENATGNESWAGSEIAEMDIAIVPMGSVTQSQNYFFRVHQAGTEVSLNAGELHPVILTVQNLAYGTLTTTLGTITVVSTGTIAITGTSSSTLGTITASSTGTVDIQGSLSKTLDAITIASTGTVEASTINGVLDITLDATTIASTGMVDVQGSLSNVLNTTTITSTGIIDIQGLSNETLDMVNIVSSGTVGETSINGVLNITLDTTTIMSVGMVDIQGSLGNTFGTITSTSNGMVDIQGIFEKTINSITILSAGNNDIRGVLSKTIDAVNLTSSGLVSIQGLLNKALDMVLLIATDAPEHDPNVPSIHTNGQFHNMDMMYPGSTRFNIFLKANGIYPGLFWARNAGTQEGIDLRDDPDTVLSNYLNQ